MSSVHVIPLLLGLLVGLLLGVIAWGLWRARRQEAAGGLTGARDDLLWGLLLLAGFGLGVFLTYLLLGLNV